MMRSVQAQQTCPSRRAGCETRRHCQWQLDPRRRAQKSELRYIHHDKLKKTADTRMCERHVPALIRRICTTLWYSPCIQKTMFRLRDAMFVCAVVGLVAVTSTARTYTACACPASRTWHAVLSHLGGAATRSWCHQFRPTCMMRLESHRLRRKKT